MKKLGKLEKVRIQEAWPNEAGDFTPWLAQEDNIAYLSEEISIDLEVQSTEEAVGPFRADIVCRDTEDDSLVLIENQYGRTDHKHLGQLLTYASGLNAVTVIWISEKFTEEHRAAIDWFNNKTDDTVAFFGIEIELYRIGDSQPAPKFNIIAKPNNWSKVVRQTAKEKGITKTRQLQFEYWNSFNAYCEENNVGFQLKEVRAHYRVSVTNNLKISLRAFANTRDKRIGVFIILRGDSGLAKIRQLKEQYELQSQQQINSNISWEESETGKKIQRIITRIQDTDPANEADWPNQHKLLVELIKKYIAFFKDKLNDL